VYGDDPRPLAGYKFLVIEDEMLQAWRVGDMLSMLGGTVGKIAFSYDQGISALDHARWDCAVLDINLHGEPVFPIVTILKQRGVPFIYCSAYAEAFSHAHPDVESAVCVSKPVTLERLKDAVLLVLKARQL
jgi:two-component SAPR family response regulator